MHNSTRINLGALALALAGVLFLLYPVVRPWNDETTAAGALASIGSGAWVAAHLFAMIGFILTPIGLLAVGRIVRGTPGAAAALPGVITMWIGAGLTLTYYGAEDFALNAGAHTVATVPGVDFVGFIDAFRYGAVPITMFGVGLVLFAVGAVVVAVAVSRSGLFRAAAAVPFALGCVLFLPQFFGPAWLRIAHGVLMAAGLLWLANETRKTGAQQLDAAMS